MTTARSVHGHGVLRILANPAQVLHVPAVERLTEQVWWEEAVIKRSGADFSLGSKVEMLPNRHTD